MKRILLSAAIVAGTALPALAADPYTPDSLKDTFTEDRNTVYFQGLGIGVDVGGQFTSVALTDSPFEFDGISADGLVGGLHLEYLFAVDPDQRTRFGVYGEGGFSNVNTTLDMGAGDIDVLKQDHYYGVGLKAGVIVYDKTLLFARFGYDWSQWSSDLALDTNADVGAWSIGGGVDTMVAEDWSFSLEGVYLMVHGVDVEGFDATEFVDESEAGRVKARLTRRF